MVLSRRKVGHFGEGTYRADTPEYSLWDAMLKRCYSEKMQAHSPTYKGCTVSDNFHQYQYFGEWCNSQTGFDIPGRQIDKDLLFRGNTLYSEDTCLFLPREINNLFIKRQNDRGPHPIGVTMYKGRFQAQLSRGLAHRCLGYFETADEAFLCYKLAKEAYIKQKAEAWRHAIDNRAYIALLNYEVNYDD